MTGGGRGAGEGCDSREGGRKRKIDWGGKSKQG